MSAHVSLRLDHSHSIAPYRAILELPWQRFTIRWSNVQENYELVRPVSQVLQDMDQSQRCRVTKPEFGFGFDENL